MGVIPSLAEGAGVAKAQDYKYSLIRRMFYTTAIYLGIASGGINVSSTSLIPDHDKCDLLAEECTIIKISYDLPRDLCLP